MMHNAEALQMMVTANRATPDTIGEILSDIQAEGVLATQIIERHRTMLRSRQLQKKPIDLHAVVKESLALVAHDMRARQVVVTVNLSSNPCVINGDQVLLQQVLVNLRDERHGRDGRDAAGPTARHDKQAKSGPPMSKSPCATPDRVCRRISSARCSHRSSRRNRMASG